MQYTPRPSPKCTIYYNVLLIFTQLSLKRFTCEGSTIMPPKKNLEDLYTQISDQLTTLTKQQEEKFENLTKLLEESKEEVASLKTTVENQSEEISTLKKKVHDLEQHSRQYSIRVYNVEIEGNASDPNNVVNQLYRKALLPILQGAVTSGRLNSVPDCDSIIETAHTLPGKEGKHKPIICRFFSRRIRTIILQCRKDSAPRAPPITNSHRPPPFLYPIYEDMASEAHRLLQQLLAHQDVTAAWVTGGTIRFKISDSDSIFRVTSVFDKVDDIVVKAKNA